MFSQYQIDGTSAFWQNLSNELEYDANFKSIKFIAQDVLRL